MHALAFGPFGLCARDGLVGATVVGVEDGHFEVGVDAVGGKELGFDVDQLFLLERIRVSPSGPIDLRQADHELGLRDLLGDLGVELNGAVVV